jgi:gluconolactonase
MESDGCIAVIDEWQPGKPAQAGSWPPISAAPTNCDSAPTQLYVAETGADHMTRFRVGPDATLTDREVYGPKRLHGLLTASPSTPTGNLCTTLIGQDKLVAITPEGDVRTLWEDGDGS